MDKNLVARRVAITMGMIVACFSRAHTQRVPDCLTNNVLVSTTSELGLAKILAKIKILH